MDRDQERALGPGSLRRTSTLCTDLVPRLMDWMEPPWSGDAFGTETGVDVTPVARVAARRETMPLFLTSLGNTAVPALSTSSPAGRYPPVLLPSIVTRPNLAQMGMIFAETVAFEALALRKTYPTTEKHETAETLAADLGNDEDLTVVLVAGRYTQSGQQAVSGFHLPWAEMEGAAASCLLFKLSPVQDVFRGDLSDVVWPGYRLDEQTK
ncbi:uncharacterized protein BO95DRAFT_459200 [Aspergillus brunneoviolaceus CBS 621.78]|uniref:Uncharacterized protein n=1 Tax=Aspergillus brunneoviolaceus CBS 621.78 TaxID=1450534 RepID=A0ACD1GNL9_9EURO|nr:hypothetical protein BO95DRAFT_459200 [Aspergillus brunneoviolaceus CBS 621.78]RAH50719.1 hypothetical protein BO95DRAFT_459200 [Aspergillus brunneoviolaceus CBS 621.78]